MSVIQLLRECLAALGGGLRTHAGHARVVGHAGSSAEGLLSWHTPCDLGCLPCGGVSGVDLMRLRWTGWGLCRW